MKGWRKLIDLADTESMRLHKALENYLGAHRIPFRSSKHFGDGFTRYWVESVNLCCASAVIPALKQMAEDAGYMPRALMEGRRD